LENLVVKIDGVKFDNLIEGYYATWIKESVATVSWSTTSRLFIIILFAIDFENLLTQKILLFIEQSLEVRVHELFGVVLNNNDTLLKWFKHSLGFFLLLFGHLRFCERLLTIYEHLQAKVA